MIIVCHIYWTVREFYSIQAAVGIIEWTQNGTESIKAFLITWRFYQFQIKPERSTVQFLLWGGYLDYKTNPLLQRIDVTLWYFSNLGSWNFTCFSIQGTVSLSFKGTWATCWVPVCYRQVINPIMLFLKCKSTRGIRPQLVQVVV